jgi:hypothetical protein
MDEREQDSTSADRPRPAQDEAVRPPAPPRRRVVQAPGEIGGPEGPEPTRYGDWERNGRVSDF